MQGTDAETVESLTKLLNISGSIEHIILQKSTIIPQLNTEFFKAVGQNKTLKSLNMSVKSSMPLGTTINLLG